MSLFSSHIYEANLFKKFPDLFKKFTLFSMIKGGPVLQEDIPELEKC